jgi:polyferredoxin/NAD-dependent dihydropyrimidine dehydrogenase PreA subunit
MTSIISKIIKVLRFISQGVFFSIFLYVFLRSLDPFSITFNPFLRFDPLILFTHFNFTISIILPIAVIIIFTILIGRYFCGWVCPLGTLIDILDLGFKPLRSIIFGKLQTPTKPINPLKPGPEPFRGPLTQISRYFRLTFHSSDSKLNLHKSPDRMAKRRNVFKSKIRMIPPAWFVLGVVVITIFFPPPVLQFTHPNVWIIRIFSLSNPGLIFLGLLAIFSLISRRLWCSVLCPLGALYGMISLISPFRLSIKKCSRCGLCKTCPMGATLFETKTVLTHQCILCFDFEHRCPVGGFHYGIKISERITPFKINRMKAKTTHGVIKKDFDESRRWFLGQVALFTAGIALGGISSLSKRDIKTELIRPPGVLDETRFVEQCLRCFQCVRSCPNQIIKITGLEAGFQSIFTPHLSFETYGCDYYCQVCQLVCPNFAIPLQSLEEKQAFKVGLATIDESRCVVYTENTNCLVCEEFCPIPEKAIKVRTEVKNVRGERILLKYPVVSRSLCIGCGICEAHCPVSPGKAIVIRKA